MRTLDIMAIANAILAVVCLTNVIRAEVANRALSKYNGHWDVINKRKVIFNHIFKVIL